MAKSKRVKKPGDAYTQRNANAMLARERDQLTRARLHRISAKRMAAAAGASRKPPTKPSLQCPASGGSGSTAVGRLKSGYRRRIKAIHWWDKAGTGLAAGYCAGARMYWLCMIGVA